MLDYGLIACLVLAVTAALFVWWRKSKPPRYTPLIHDPSKIPSKAKRLKREKKLKAVEQKMSELKDNNPDYENTKEYRRLRDEHADLMGWQKEAEGVWIARELVYPSDYEEKADERQAQADYYEKLFAEAAAEPAPEAQ